ncbi:Leucine-responsive regulatory protein [compost metagenome]
MIQLLKGNGRESSSNLGRRLNLARTTVAARITRLERDGVIKGYSVKLSSEAEGASVRAYCSISVAPRSGVSVIRALGKMLEVEEVSSVSGQFDYVAFLCCTSHERLDDLLDRIGNLEGVQLTQTSVILNRKIDRRSAAC